jgi:hypothetical protein
MALSNAERQKEFRLRRRYVTKDRNELVGMILELKEEMKSLRNVVTELRNATPPPLGFPPLINPLTSLPPHPKKDSEAYASGADAPVGELDPIKDLFDRGLAILGVRNRAILGKARKEFDDIAVIEAIARCEDEHPSDPVAFFFGCLRHRKEQKVNGHKQSPVEKFIIGAGRAAEAFAARSGINYPIDAPLLDC